MIYPHFLSSSNFRIIPDVLDEVVMVVVVVVVVTVVVVVVVVV